MLDPTFSEQLTTVAGVATLTTMLVTQLRAAFPEITGSIAVLITWLVAPALAITGWLLGFTPETTDWRQAAALGLNAALVANGGYSALKAGLTDRAIAKETKPRRVRRPGGSE